MRSSDKVQVCYTSINCNSAFLFLWSVCKIFGFQWGKDNVNHKRGIIGLKDKNVCKHNQTWGITVQHPLMPWGFFSSVSLYWRWRWGAVGKSAFAMLLLHIYSYFLLIVSETQWKKVYAPWLCLAKGDWIRLSSQFWLLRPAGKWTKGGIFLCFHLFLYSSSQINK